MTDYTFGRAVLAHGSCLNCLRHLTPADMLFADPPFNIGQKYKGYRDTKPEEKYRQWTAQWVKAAGDAVAAGGVLVMHGADEQAKLWLTMEDTLLCGADFQREAWINWHWRFGQCGRTKWIQTRAHCLVYRKAGGTRTWNPEAVLVESDRVRMKDKRVDETERGGHRLPGTVWGVAGDGDFWGRVPGNSRERVKSMPNQLPEVYLQRLVAAYTNEGDGVIDPFGGSGTTAVVCNAMGRYSTTIEISASSCTQIKKRLERGAVRT